MEEEKIEIDYIDGYKIISHNPPSEERKREYIKEINAYFERKYGTTKKEKPSQNFSLENYITK